MSSKEATQAGKPRILQFSTRRVAWLILGVASYAGTEFARLSLRPYARAHDLDGYGFTEWIGNLGGVLVQIFLSIAILHPRKRMSFLLVGFFSLGFVAYEFAQPYLPRGTFDWNDVWGTLGGGVIGLVVIALTWLLFPESET